MNTVDDDTHGAAFVMLANAGNGLLEIRVNQAGHR